MSRMSCVFLLACFFVAPGSTVRLRSAAGVKASPIDVSQYFFDYLTPFFPNSYRPSTSLRAVTYDGMDISGAPGTPIEFNIQVVLFDNAKMLTITCVAKVHLGNYEVNPAKFQLYFGEEADLLGCPK